MSRFPSDHPSPPVRGSPFHSKSFGYLPRFMRREFASTRRLDQRQEARPNTAGGRSVSYNGWSGRSPNSSADEVPMRHQRSDRTEYVVVDGRLRQYPTSGDRSRTAPPSSASSEQSSPHSSVRLRHQYPSSGSLSSQSSRTTASYPSPRIKVIQRRVNVLVFGSTGVGKSTFIRNLVERSNSDARRPRQGHSLESCTSEYEGFPYLTPDGQEVMLFDTPGFDDSRMSDAENLAALARFLQSLHRQGQRIDGVIFMNPVTDVRLQGSTLKMAEVLMRVCGQKFLPRVALVTSMWDLIDRQTARRRENIMLSSSQFWGDFSRGGATTFQLDNQSTSAEAIVRFFVEVSRHDDGFSPVLRISSELQNGLSLSETSAGDFLLGELSKQKDRHLDAVRELRREILKAQQSGDRALAKDFADEERHETSCARQAEYAERVLNSSMVSPCR
jgi:GTPase SAR1 family protein